MSAPSASPLAKHGFKQYNHPDIVPTTSESLTTEHHVPRRRWRIAFLLGLGVLVNYVDRVNLSVSQSALHDEFGISTITFGYLLSAYSLTYAMLQLPVGVILDRFGVKIVGRISTFLWSVASFAAALSTGVASLFSARLLLGVGEAPTFPANAKATGYWFPKEERSFATSIFDAAAKLAPALGVPIIGVLLLHFGWRKSFAFTGMVSFGYFLLFYWVYRNPSEDDKLTESERRLIAEGGAQPEVAFAIREKGASLWYLLQQRKMIGLALGFASYNYTFYLLLTWLPSYLSSAFTSTCYTRSSTRAFHGWSLRLPIYSLVASWWTRWYVVDAMHRASVRSSWSRGRRWAWASLVQPALVLQPWQSSGSAFPLEDCLQQRRWDGPFLR